jgi:hypothetical protein
MGACTPTIYAAPQAELAEIKRDLDELRTCLRELQAAVQARWAAEARLADPYRERSIALAAERDPTLPLN